MIDKCPNDGTRLILVSGSEKPCVECPRCGFSAPKNYMKIKEMFCFVSVDPGDGNEGIITARMGSMAMPLVGADMDRVESLVPLVKKLQKESGTIVKLLKFTTRGELEF